MDGSSAFATGMGGGAGGNLGVLGENSDFPGNEIMCLPQYRCAGSADLSSTQLGRSARHCAGAAPAKKSGLFLSSSGGSRRGG